MSEDIFLYEESHCSTELNELTTALAKAQLEMKEAKLTKKNSFLKSDYAPLEAVIRASRPALAKNGLAVLQPILPHPRGTLFLCTRLSHSSGQWMESRMPLTPEKSDIQSMGKYITYVRRYCYASLCGVSLEGDDDDGEAAMMNRPKEETPPTVNKSELDLLSSAVGSDADMLQHILAAHQINKLSELPKSKFHQVYNRIREVKELSKEAQKSREG